MFLSPCFQFFGRGDIPRNRIDELYNFIFNFFKNCHTIFHSNYRFTVSPAVNLTSNVSTSLPTLVIFQCHFNNHLDEYNDKIWSPLVYLLAMYVQFIGELSKFLPPFEFSFCFLLLSYKVF